MEEQKLIDEDYLIENRNKTIKCGIAWDIFNKAIDLDVGL